MIRPAEALELCSKAEWTLLESSFPPAVETLPFSDLKSRMNRVGRLHRKSEALVHRQHSDDRKRTTHRKIELFAEAIGRFETALTFLESAHTVAPVSKSIESGEPAEETRTRNIMALQDRAAHQLESRKKHVLSAIAVRGEQGSKPGTGRQNHAGSAARRQQGRRDTKSR